MAVFENPAGTQYHPIASPESPFALEDGGELRHAEVAYETWGELNESRDNAILLFHALSGSQHAAGDPSDPPRGEYWTGDTQIGWWDDFVGPGKALDTDRFFIVCCNYLGGCYGSTGSASINPETGKPYGSAFPWPTVGDIVRSQFLVLDALGVERLHAVVGASVGGLCALDAAVRYADRIDRCVVLAAGVRATVLTRSQNLEQIFAIQEDPDFAGGDYYEGNRPWRGLCLARMISHKTYVSLSVMERRARAEIVQPNDVLFGYKLRHRIESYLLHQGKKFIERFDANAYLRILSAWQNFDLTAATDGDIVEALKPCRHQRWLLFSISSDVCFYPEEQGEIAGALKELGVEHQYITVHSEKGHDSFLLEPELYVPQLSYTLNQPAGR